MILSFFRKCFFYCIFIVILSSCTPGNNTTSKADLSKDKAPVVEEEPSEDNAPPEDSPPLEEGSTEDDPVTSEQGESLPPPEAAPETPAKGEEQTAGTPPAVDSTEGDSTAVVQEESLPPPEAAPETPAKGEEQTAGTPPAVDSTEGDSTAVVQEESLPPPEAAPETPAKGEEPKDSAPPAGGSAKTGQISPLRPLLDKNDYEFELKDIINAGLLKEEDSDLVKTYFYIFLNAVNFSIKQGNFIFTLEDIQREWCHTPDCLSGMDLKKLKEPHQMRNLVVLFSLGPTDIYFSDEDNKPLEYFGLFQSYLATPGWGLQSYQNLKEGETPTHITDMQKMIDQMTEAGVKNVSVNLPFQRHVDPLPFFMLGKFMKENQMDLHIMGNCEAYCAKYLIPAAKTVHIGPYGYIHFHGSFGGMFEQAQSALPIQKAANRNLFREELSNMGKDRKVEVLDSALEQLNSMGVFIDRFKASDPESAQEFQKKLQAFYPAVNKTDIKAFTKEERVQFLGQFSLDLLDSLALALTRRVDNNTISREDYIKTLEALLREEFIYYRNIEFNYGTFDENNRYTYAGLLHLAAKLVKDSAYARIFSVSRPYYNIPEGEKSYNTIVPSADLLRLWFDVRGENNIDILGIDKNSKQNFLYLDSKRIENCDFFGEGVSYKTLDCLFE